MGRSDNETPEEKKATALFERLERQFWRIVALYMMALALGVAISAIVVIFLISFIIFLEVH